MRFLALAAFVLLAAGLCARCLLYENRTLSVGHLVTQSDTRWAASLMARHVCHLVAAGGIALAALWAALSRRRWRFGGLEAGAILLAGAAMLAVPAASDKRLAANAAIDTILPLAAAAALYQLLIYRAAWRSALLAALVAVAAANCWMATAQWGWQYRQGREFYLQNKARIWAQQGVRLDDPQVAAFERDQLAARPMGFIQGPNVLSSFLLLGLAGTGAALAACRWRRPVPARARHATAITRPAALTILAGAALALLAAWHLVVMSWVRTAGSMVALLAALAAAAVIWHLRNRRRRLAIVLGGGLLLLEAGLVGLAMTPGSFHQSLLGYQGAANKVRTLTARLCYWRACVDLCAASPLTGVGPSQFATAFLAVRPPYSNENPPDAHNWLLNVAAEWGLPGVLGVLAALALCGWTILGGLARPASDPDPPAGGVLLPAAMVVVACWCLVASDLSPGSWLRDLPGPAAVSLVAAAIAGTCRVDDMRGRVVLLAGLVGFFVHCAAEITPSVPGVMWPFWAAVALAMACGQPSAAPAAAERLLPRRTAAGPLLAAAAVLAVVILSIRPMRAAGLMQQARHAVLDNRRQDAIALLASAAAVDPLDPLPLKTSAFLQYRLAQSDPTRAVEHFRQYVALSRAAAQRNPRDCMSWRSLAMADMYLATATGDAALVDEAIRSMRHVLELNPYWPAGWLDLARMAAVTDDRQPERPALLRTALDAAQRALDLDDIRPRAGPHGLTTRDRAELQQMQADLASRLKASETSQPSAEPARPANSSPVR